MFLIRGHCVFYLTQIKKMKNLHIIYVLLFSIFLLSCSSSDENNDPAEGPNSQATINGGTFSNYAFKLGVYQIVKGTNGNTLNMQMADKKGIQITLFLNGTGDFKSGTVKQMGNVDSNESVTHAWIRDIQPPVSYISKSGTLKIKNNREHPSNSQQRLISGEFNIVALSEDGKQTTTMKGSFNDLVFTK